jgi:DNA-binding transcriptional LysR family regulator
MPGKARLRFDSFDLLLAAAVEGLGVMLASLPLSEVAVARGQLERLPGPGMETGAGYWLNWQSEARHSTVESDLVEALKRCLA